LRDRFRQCGMNQSYIDGEGNCIALRQGEEQNSILVVSAHLDTVFPAGTDFKVRRDGYRLIGPGIADNGCGLIALISLIRALETCQIKTKGSVLFVGTVGEEGIGDLRGVRYLFTKGEWTRKIDAFISFDGPGIECITHGGIGSRRYRVRYSGPGGHSWIDFGVANPVHALGLAIARLSTYPVPLNPRTTFNVGRIDGGTGINVIAPEAIMEVDLRSESMEELQRLDAYFRRIVHEIVEIENSKRTGATNQLKLDLTLIGDRPSGETPKDSTLVRLAVEATNLLGYEPVLDYSSTDSNIPISLGIPAITIGAGGTSGPTHTLNEWYDPHERDVALKRALLLMLGVVGLKD
jgi:tripeptide aminopeptidase